MFAWVIYKECPKLNYFIHMLVWITQDVWNSVRYLYWPIEYSNSLHFLYQMQYYDLHNSSVHTVRLSYIPILVYGLSLQCPNQHLYVNLFQPCFSQYSFFEHISYIRILFSKLNRNRHLYQWFSWTIIYTLVKSSWRFWISEKNWSLFAAFSEGIPKLFGRIYSPAGSRNKWKSWFFLHYFSSIETFDEFKIQFTCIVRIVPENKSSPVWKFFKCIPQ